MSNYYITSSADTRWNKVTAKTLKSAKAAASKAYHQAVGGKIIVGQKIGQGTAERIEHVAVKYGFDKWQQAL